MKCFVTLLQEDTCFGRPNWSGWSPLLAHKLDPVISLKIVGMSDAGTADTGITHSMWCYVANYLSKEIGKEAISK